MCTWRGVSDFMAQCTTSIQCVQRSVIAPPPKFQSKRHLPGVGETDEQRGQLLFTDSAKVGVRGRLTFRSSLDGVPPRPVNVADCDNLIGIVAGPVGGVEQIVHATAGADDADA